MFFPEPLSKSSAVGWDEESMCSIRRGPDPCVTRSLRKQPPPAACSLPEPELEPERAASRWSMVEDSASVKLYLGPRAPEPPVLKSQKVRSLVALSP